jgi:STE24 endopeptidase
MVRAARFLLLSILLFGDSAFGQTSAASAPSVLPPANQAAVVPAFDIKAAVDAYLAKMPPTQRARSDAYFEGGYWLLLWDFLSTVVVMWLLLHFRWSARMRNLAERLTRFRPLQTAIYWIQFIVLVSLVTFPLSVYEGYFREHKYGLLNQTFGPWMRDQLVMLIVNVVLGAILLVPLFGLVRRLGKNWWVWGATLTVVFAAFVILIAPVYSVIQQVQDLAGPANQRPHSQHGPSQRNSRHRCLRVRRIAAVESGERQRQRVRWDAADFAERQSAEALHPARDRDDHGA